MSKAIEILQAVNTKREWLCWMLGVAQSAESNIPIAFVYNRLNEIECFSDKEKHDLQEVFLIYGKNNSTETRMNLLCEMLRVKNNYALLILRDEQNKVIARALVPNVDCDIPSSLTAVNVVEEKGQAVVQREGSELFSCNKAKRHIYGKNAVNMDACFGLIGLMVRTKNIKLMKPRKKHLQYFNEL